MTYLIHPLGSLLNWFFMSASAVLNVIQSFFLLLSKVKFLIFSLAAFVVAFAFSKTKTGQIFLQYLIESKKEMKKVSWPNHQETLNTVWMVSAFVVFAATFWWLIDAAITKVFALILRVVS
jgi:preprotein translocase subunit SecE